MSIINQQAEKPRPFGRGSMLALPIFTGSDPSAASGRSSEVSEWQRSADEEGACHRRRCRAPQQDMDAVISYDVA